MPIVLKVPVSLKIERQELHCKTFKITISASRLHVFTVVNYSIFYTILPVPAGPANISYCRSTPSGQSSAKDLQFSYRFGAIDRDLQAQILLGKSDYTLFCMHADNAMVHDLLQWQVINCFTASTSVKYLLAWRTYYWDSEMGPVLIYRQSKVSYVIQHHLWFIIGWDTYCLKFISFWRLCYLWCVYSPG